MQPTFQKTVHCNSTTIFQTCFKGKPVIKNLSRQREPAIKISTILKTKLQISQKISTPTGRQIRKSCRIDPICSVPRISLLQFCFHLTVQRSAKVPLTGTKQKGKRMTPAHHYRMTGPIRGRKVIKASTGNRAAMCAG